MKDIEDILPDIDAFSPWCMTEKQLDVYIQKQLQELRVLHASEKEYNISLSMALYSAINSRKLRNFCFKQA